MPYDVVAFGETMLRLSPPPGVRLEDADTLSVHVAGSESNVLCCLSRLGLRCAWLSALPASPPGRRVAGELARHGVDVGHVRWKPAGRLGLFYAEEAPPPLGVRVTYDRADSSFANTDPAAFPLLALDGARLLHLSGITPALGGNPRAAWERLLDAATERGVPLSVDINYRAKLWGAPEAAEYLATMCCGASIVFCASADAALLWGLEGGPEEVLRGLGERFGSDRSQTLVLTLGAQGSAQLRDGRYEAAPAFPSTGTVRFGSGDAFAAGYLYAHLGGPFYERAREDVGATPLLYGNACAALKRCVAGDIAVISPDEVDGMLRSDQAARFR